jgi:hypothetical protein
MAKTLGAPLRALLALLTVTLAACDSTSATGDDAGPADARATDGAGGDHSLTPGPDDGPSPADGAPRDSAPRDGAPRDGAPVLDGGVDAPGADAAPLTCATGAYTCDLDGGTGYCCGALCADVATDHDHCGSCATACGEDEVCLGGTCLVTSCAAPAVTFTPCLAAPGAQGSCCDGACRSQSYYATAATDCNGCGQHCPVGATCVEDPPGFGQCTLDGGPAYCGSGAACPAATSCASGQSTCIAESCGGRADMYLCALAGEGGRCCAGTCTSVEFDPAHCGACGRACPSGTWCHYGSCVATQACDPLVSGAACSVSTTHAGACCGGSCVDPTTDSTNCGQCGNVCPLGTTCENWICKKPDGTTGYCYDAGCPAGLLCTYSACWSPQCAPGSSGPVCAFGPDRPGTCCGGECVDVKQDPGNCGQCGHGCGGDLCVGGSCFDNAPATSSHQACSSYGGCPAGERCDYTHECVTCSDWSFGEFCYGTEQCFQGRCLSASCANAMPGTQPCFDSGAGLIGVCCGGFFNPHCADVFTDPNNCGECDRKCPAGIACVGGECAATPAACGAGHHGAYCALDAGASSVCCVEGCVDLDHTNTSCGGCGYACGAGLTCVDGACLAFTCTIALENTSCAGDGGVGTCCSAACVDRKTDPTNCGTCGHVCSVGMTCQGGGCGFDVCDAAHLGAACHLDDTQLGRCCSAGCVDTKTDNENCGGCGQPCPPPTTCQNGACHA